MELWRRARADLSRPSVPIGRDPFLLIGALVIAAVAQWSDPGTKWELLALTPSVGAIAVVALGVAMPLELLAALVVVPVTVVVGNQGHLEGAMFLPVLVTLYTSWRLGSTIRATLVMAGAAIAPWFAVDVLLSDLRVAWTPWTAANVFTYAMGLTLRNQRVLIEQLHEAREALAQQAVAEERRKIARELHDLAGHTLSSMMLHVTGARHVLARDPAEAERALRDAEEVGRSSLDQIRATVAALRTAERGTDPALAGSADVAELVEGYRRAGLTVELELASEAAGLVGPTGTAVHRLVQEALANVARHAPHNDVEVRVVPCGDDLVVEVTDRGRRPSPAQSTGVHFGLVGMRERARALGGELTAGPHGDGWRVEARLPLPSTAEAT